MIGGTISGGSSRVTWQKEALSGVFVDREVRTLVDTSKAGPGEMLLSFLLLFFSSFNFFYFYFSLLSMFLIVFFVVFMFFILKLFFLD